MNSYIEKYKTHKIKIIHVYSFYQTVFNRFKTENHHWHVLRFITF